MANGIRTGDPRGFNKGRSSKFPDGSRVRQTPEEGRRTYRAKRYRNNNKDEDNSPKTLNDKNQQVFYYHKIQNIIVLISKKQKRRDFYILEKKLDGNYTRMLRAILNKSWQQHPTRHQLYGHLPPITKTIQVRRTRQAGHCWRSRDELIRDVHLWTPTHGRAKAGRPARTYIQQLCEDTGCCPEDLPRAMNDREEWRERVRDIRATSAIWWWWWWWWWWWNTKNQPYHFLNTKWIGLITFQLRS